MKRRSFLQIALSHACILFSVPIFAASQVRVSTLQLFMRLSETLTTFKSLDPNHGARYFSALVSRIGIHRAHQLLAAPSSLPPDLQSIANEIVADWYSGTTIHQGINTCVDYTGALVWKAAHFTKPQSICGGKMGYWAAKPVRVSHND